MKKILLISNIILLFINLFLLLWVVDFYFDTSILTPLLFLNNLRFLHALYLLIPGLIIEVVLYLLNIFNVLKIDKLFILNSIISFLMIIVFILFVIIFFQM